MPLTLRQAGRVAGGPRFRLPLGVAIDLE